MNEKLNNLTNILNDIDGGLTTENVTDAVDTLVAASNISGISPDVSYFFLSYSAEIFSTYIQGNYFDKSIDLTLQKGSDSFNGNSTEKLDKNK